MTSFVLKLHNAVKSSFAYKVMTTGRASLFRGEAQGLSDIVFVDFVKSYDLSLAGNARSAGGSD